jgi:nucleotide-binding universal stress UspA family protein
MEKLAPRCTQHLSLDSLTVNPGLARRLPLALARRYHALPVARDNGHITVAMANPDDSEGRRAIVAALGTTCYMVRGDQAAIDALVAEIWQEEAHHSLRLLVCTQASPSGDEVKAYAQAIGNLLSAHVDHLDTSTTAGAALDALVGGVERTGYDLAILGGANESLIERLLWGSIDRRATKKVPFSLLVARQPRWPLRRMLLLIRGEGADEVAVDWVVRLARPSGASVTVLAIVPPIPAMYQGMARMRQGLAELLAGDSALGHQMRGAGRRLADWEINSILRLCQGSPDRVVHRELAEGDYDLIAVAAEHHHCWLRWLLGELVAPMLREAARPVLIAKYNDA